MAGTLAELAYEASLRRLDKQEQLLEELRARFNAFRVAAWALAAEVALLWTSLTDILG